MAIRTWAAAAFVAAFALAGCGPGPSSPTLAAGDAAPTNFAVLAQRVNLSSNEVDLVWSGTASSYRVSIGSAPGLDDVQHVESTTGSITWLAPRTANTYFARVAPLSGGRAGTASTELTITTIDLRDLIDALYFHAGPHSIGKATQPDSFSAPVWADGTRLRVSISSEAGAGIRTRMQSAIDAYAAAVKGTVTGSTELVDDPLRTITHPSELPPFTIVARVIPGYCGAAAAACAFTGPAPAGPNASILTFHTASAPESTVAHETGHAYGFPHILGVAATSSFRFVMTSPSTSQGFSQPELAAIAAAHAGGIRAGTTRAEALALGLVLPWPR